MAEENPYLQQIAKNSGLPEKTVDTDNPYILQAQKNAGKPLEYKETPDKFMSGLEQAAGTINVTNKYQDSLANYAKYDVGLSPFGEDWNEIRANNQGVGEKIGRGLLKMGATMSGAIAENTIGVFSGLASMATGGTYADNAVGRSVDEMNEWMAENLPHYYTQKEQDPDRSMLAALGTANFWTDKFANGLGYSLGSLATVWATGGTGLIGRAVGLAGKGIATFGEAAAVGKIATTGDKLKKIYEASKMIKTGAKLSDDVTKAAKIARGLNAAKHLEVGAMMSLAESSVEAREKSKEFIREQFAAWEEANPGKSAQQDMTAEERQAILDSARAVENTAFGLNMAILMPTNLFTFGSMIGGSKKLAGIPVGESLTDDIIKQGDKYVLKTPSTSFGKTLQKVNKFTSPIYKNSLNEAFQEGAQYAIGVGASEYFKNKFDTGSGDFAGALMKGMSETFGSADGRESMLLGALIGGGMGAVSTSVGAEASRRKTVAANTEALLNIKNSATFTNLTANAEQNDEILRTITGITAANQMGNYKVANELRKQLIAQRAAKFQALDAEDLALEEFDDLEKMSEEEFMKRTGYDTTKTEDGKLKTLFSEQSGGKSHVQVVQELKEQYKKAAQLNRDLDDIIQRVNPIKTGLPGLFQSKEQKQADATQRLYNQRLKAIMMQHMVGIDTRDEEIDASINELRKLSPEGPDSFANISKDDILALVKKNKITMSSSGEIQFPKSVVSTTITDTDTEEEKAKKKAEAQTSEGKREKKEEEEDNKVLSKLEKALIYAENLNPIAKMKFENELANLFTGLRMREESIAAFEELMTSPEKRDLAILAKQSAKIEAKIANDNKEASIVIDEARSTADLDALINTDTLSPELKERLLKKYKELEEVEDKYAEDFNILTDEHLKDLMLGIDEIKDSDPQKAVALMKVVAARAGETKAQKEARVAANDKQKEAQAAAEASVAGLGTSQANTPNAKQYVNKIRVTTSDNRNLIINGVPYRNDNINIMDALELDMVAMSEDGQIPVIAVNLTNKAGQKVRFAAEQDPILAQELAEVIMTGYISEGTADTVDMTREEAEDKANNILKLSKKKENALETQITIKKEDRPESSVYDFGIKELQRFLDGLFQAKKLLEDAYKRDGQPDSVVQGLESYQSLVQMLETYTKKLEQLQQDYRDVMGMPSQVDPSITPAELNNQDSIEVNNEVNRLKSMSQNLDVKIAALRNLIQGIDTAAPVSDKKAQIDDIERRRQEDLNKFGSTSWGSDLKQPFLEKFGVEVNGWGSDTTETFNGPNPNNDRFTVFDLRQIINAKYDAELAALGQPSAPSGVAQEELAKLQESLNLAIEEQSQLQSQINKLEEEDESRKSSESSKEVQTPEGAEGPVAEQGDTPAAEGDVQVPPSEELDINAEEETGEMIFGSDAFSSVDLFAEEETDDVDIKSDFEQEEEEEVEDIIDEDTPVRETTATVVDEEETEINENAGEIDARLVKNEYRTTEDYNNVIVDTDGTPLASEDYKEQKDLKGNKITIEPRVLSSHIYSPQGSEIVFEVRPDTDYWNKIKDSIPANRHWEKVPIFVKVRTPQGLKTVGMLEGYNPNKAESNQSRKDIYENFLKGKKVTSTIAGKRGIHNSQNIANAVTKKGEIFFYSPFQYGAIPTLAIATPQKESGMSKWEVFLRGDNVTEKDAIPSFEADRRHLGRVAMIVRTPLGGFKQLFLTTRRMTQAGLNAAKIAIVKGRPEKADDLVGFNLIAEMAVALNRTDMIFSTDITPEGSETKERLYRFYLPKAESYIAINSSELAKAIAKQSFKFGFIKATVGEKGGVDWNTDTTKSKLHKLVQDGVVTAFEEAVMRRRYQVDGFRLADNEEFESPFLDPNTAEGKIYNSYIGYLADPEAIPDIDSEDQSHTGILMSDMYLNEDGSPYFDIGITYGPMLVDGKKLINSEETISSQSASSKITPEEEEEDDEYTDDNDDDDESDDSEDEDDINNSIFSAVNGGEEVEEEEEVEDETAGSTTTMEDLLKARGLVSEAEATEEEEEEPTIAKEEEDDSGLEDPLIARLIDVQKNEYKGMFKDTITGEETHYKIQPKGDPTDRKFARISSFASEPFKGDKQIQIASSRAGNSVHDIVESILMGKTDFTRGDKMSRVAFLELISQVADIKRLIVKNKETVLATEMIVYRGKDDRYDGQEFAGKFDILVKKPKKKGKPTEYHIYDIKTGSEASLNSYDKGYTDPETKKVSKSKRDQHGTQLSLYAYSLVGLGDLKPANITGSVLFIPIRYNTEGYIEKVSNMAEKKFTLNFNVKELLKGNVSFEQKKVNTTSDPSINNAGKKKGSTKATTKSKAPKGKEVDTEEKGVKKKGKVTKESLASDLINAGESKDGPAAGVDKQLADLKKSITKSGGMDDTVFIQIVKDTFGITLTEEESDKLQNDVLKGECE